MESSPAPQAVLLAQPLNRMSSFVQRHLLRISVLVILGCAIVIAGLAVWICLSGAPRMRGVELDVILTVQKTLQGLPLYTDPGDIPFDIGFYGPFYYLLCIGLARLFHISFDDPARLLLLGRLVSLLCAALIFAGVYRIATRIFRLRPLLGLACTAFAFVITSPWYFMARPDALMCLAMLACFGFAIAAASRQGTVAYVYLLAAVCFGCICVFTKQNGVHAITIVPLYFLFVRQYRRFAASLAATVVIGGLVFAWMAHLYPQLVPNVIGGVDNGISVFNTFEKTYGRVFSNHAFVFGLTLLALIRWAQPDTDVRHAFFLVSLPVLFAVAVVTGLKDGSGENYFDEFLVVAVIAAGSWLQASDALVGSPAAGRNRSLLLTLIAAYLVSFLPYWTITQVYRYWWLNVKPKVSLLVPPNSFWSQNYYAVARELRDDLRSDPQALVLSFVLPLNCFISERALVPQKEVATQLYAGGVQSYSRLHRYVAEGRVKYVVTGRTSPLPDSFLGAKLSDRYVWDRERGEFAVYRYRGQ